MIKHLAAALAASTLVIAPASATTFIFKGDGNNVTPEGVAGTDFVACASSGDFCSVEDHTAGLNFLLDGININVVAFADGIATRLIQDRNPIDSGLGAWSEENGSDDQTQFDAGESIEFNFDMEYTITNVEFNAGGDRDCTAAASGGGEGPCGEFRLDIYDLSDMLISSMTIDITNTDVLATLGTGARFVLTALTPGAGFTVASLTVNEVPIPGALWLLMSGVAGLGFASRKKDKAAA